MRRLVAHTIAEQGVTFVAVARELEPSWLEGAPDDVVDVVHDEVLPFGKGVVAADEGACVDPGSGEGVGFVEAVFPSAVPEVLHDGVLEAISDSFKERCRGRCVGGPGGGADVMVRGAVVRLSAGEVGGRVSSIIGGLLGVAARRRTR